MSWLSDLGDFISGIPIVGNVTDFIDKSVYDTFDVIGQGLGLNKANNLLGMSEDQFRNQIMHPIGIAAATYGLGSALSAPASIGEGAAAGSAGMAGAEVGSGLAGLEMGTAAELPAWATAGADVAGATQAAGTGSMLAAEGAGAMTAGEAAAAASAAGETDLAAILADMGANADYNAAIMAGSGAAGGAAVDSGLTASQGMNLENYSNYQAIQNAPAAVETPASTGIWNYIKSGASSLIPESTLGKTALAGMLLNVAGNAMGAGQTNQNLENYRNAAAWTPDRVNALTTGIQTDVGNIYGGQKKAKQNTIASNLAELGRSGGSAGRLKFQLDEATREAKASAVTNALLKAGVFTPPGQITGGGAYGEVNPWAQSAVGASGALGNTSNALMTMAMMKRLYPEMSI